LLGFGVRNLTSGVSALPAKERKDLHLYLKDTPEHGDDLFDIAMAIDVFELLEITRDFFAS